MLDAMLGEEIRLARIGHGLTQSKLARDAGVPRSQLRKLEEGGNVTLETVRKVLAQLPNLRSVSLGAVEMHTGAIDPTTARQAITDLIAAGYRVLAVLDAATPPPAAATRFEGGTRVDADLERRLRELEAAVQSERAGRRES